jgi:Periplasmic component of the Tol biopolymer transport system
VKDIKTIARGKIVAIILIFSVFWALPIKAQFYSIGTDPASVKWRYIRAGDFKVIYPQELDSLARRYAFLLNSSQKAVLAPLKAKIRPIDVILHPYSVNSNGVVTWAPRRMELMTRPPANGGYAQNWEKQLVVHELRHVGQVSKFENGIFKPLRFLIGEQATGLGVGVYMGGWTLEGDAVVSETEFSASGRGRDADHLIYYRAAFLNEDNRSWYHWKLGSLKHYAPNEYSLGYMMGSFIKFDTGKKDYLGDITNLVIDQFYNPYGERRGYEKYTGRPLIENFDNIQQEMTDMWSREDAARAPFSPFEVLNRDKKDFISYTYPVVSSVGKLFAVKSDMDNIRRLISVSSSGEETTERYLGYITSPPVMVGDKIYWTESIPSERWELQSFSDIFMFDPATDKTVRLTKRGAFYHPFVSEEGIMVTSYPVSGSSEIVLLNGTTFAEKWRIAAPRGGQIRESVLYKGEIYATAITETGLGLYRLKSDNLVKINGCGEDSDGDNLKKVGSNFLDASEWSVEIADQSRQMKDLRVTGDGIYFVSDLDGVSNLYCYEPETKSVKQLTNARFGVEAGSVSPMGDIVLYSDFDHKGYSMVSADRKSLLWKEVSISDPYRYEVADKMSELAGFSIDTVKIDPKVTSEYESKRYSKVANLIKIHSWAPLFYDVDKIKSMSFESIREVVKAGAIVYSQNSLNSANMMAGYSYDRGFHAGHLKFTYKGLYPVFEANMSYNTRNRESSYIDRTSTIPKQVRVIMLGAPYFEGYIRAYLPINLSRRGGWAEGFVPSLVWRYTNDSHHSEAENRFLNYQYVTAAARYYKVMNMAARDIFPKYGFGISAQVTSAPFAKENFGSLLYTNAYGYIPGLIESQGIRINAAYQHQFYDGKRYLFSNYISTPDGYVDRISRRAAYLSAEYAMPLYTQDISFGLFLYIKRFQLTPFVQYMYSHSGNNLHENLLSFGSDFVADFHLLGISTQLTAGVRAAVTKEGSSYFGLIFKTELF